MGAASRATRHRPASTAPQVDWFNTSQQEASTEALAHRWDPSGAEGVRRLEAFLQAVRRAHGGARMGGMQLV